MLEDNLKLFKENDWQLVKIPEVQTPDCHFLQGGSYISSNMLSISPKCVVIEEQEVGFYHLLEDMGFDVITIPFKHFTAYGGAIHCSTWDIRRDEDNVDCFPNQDYEAELKEDLSVVKNKNPADYTKYAADSKYDTIHEEIRKKL